jgi:hypothetical protein
MAVATNAERAMARTARSLRGVSGDMTPRDRLAVMTSLLGQATTSARYTGRPDPAGLIRLAAHALVWAEELEGGEG